MQVSLVLMPMVPKPWGGGHRLIGIFSALHGLWAKARSGDAARWERATDRPWMAAGKGRSPLDVVWRAEAAAAAAGATQGFSACATIDLSKFYECISHRLLCRRAI